MNQTLLARNARQILLAASQNEVGIRVKVVSPNLIDCARRGRQVLYRFKNEDGDFKNLLIKLDPDEPETHLWIIRTDTGLIAKESEEETTKKSEPTLDLKIEL